MHPKTESLCHGIDGNAVFRQLCCHGARTYKILLDRPEKVRRYLFPSMPAASYRRTPRSMCLAPIRKRNLIHSKVNLRARSRYSRSMSKAASRAKSNARLTSWTKSEQPALDAGTVVTAENTTGQTTFTINDMPVDPASVRLALDLFLGRCITRVNHRITKSSGTDKEQSVAATWPIDSAACPRRALPKAGLPISKDDIKGEAKLVAAKTVDGNEAVEIHADMNVEKLTGDTPQRQNRRREI